jgi:hypothetical protein
MKIQNRYKGRIKIKRTEKDRTQFYQSPLEKNYLLLDKISNIENYFHKKWNKYKFDSIFLGSSLTNYGNQREIAWRGMDEMRKYEDKIKKEKMSKAEYFYFNLQREKNIKRDLKNDNFTKKIKTLEEFYK